MEPKDLRTSIESLSFEQRALLEKRLLARRAGAPVDKIPRRDPAEPCPLAATQQRLWFLDRLNPGSAVYNEPSALRLEGALDAAALGRALDEIVARHEVLRTVFTVVHGEPRQVVQPPRSLVLDAVDFSALADAARSAEVARVLTEVATRPFDLTADLMLRACLIRLTPEEYILLLVKHHIASDSWSASVLWSELEALYAAFSTGKPSPLPPLPIQYADFALWQRRWLEDGVLERQIAYWRGKLDGVPPELGLRGDRPRPEVQTHRGDRVSRLLPIELAESLKALGQAEGATLFMVLLTALAVLLYRYTGRDDLIIATPVAGRTRLEIEPLIGFFVGTLPLRVSLGDQPTARELLDRVRKTALEAYANQDVPFDRLVEALAPERSRNRSPLVQVLLALQNARGALPALRGLRISRVPVGTETAKFDLSVHVMETSWGLDVTAIHSAELFDAGTIARLLEHLEILLGAIVANPDCRVSMLPMLGASERQQLLVEWNRTEHDSARPATIHGMVAAQIARTPAAPAVVHQGTTLSYAELGGRARALAQRLREMGVGREVLVAVCLPRSPALVVALLGVLEAGGAYVPLDPDHPDERLRLVLEDARAGIVLTDETQRRRLGEGPWRAVYVDGETATEGLLHGASHTPDDSAHLAYVAYTSGSTGRPKGVLCTHGGAANYLAFVLDTYGLGVQDVVLPRSSVAFDASVREIFGTLAAGALLVFLDDGQVRDPRTLLAGVRAHGATILTVVPSLLRALITEAEATGPVPSLRLLLVAGEPLLALDVERAREHLAPRAEVVNQYGPTECTIISTFHVARPEVDHRHVVPIGRPVWNARLFVLDAHREPVPIGVPGELYIGGVGVARGYLGAPGLTAERFPPDPFSNRPGARMYRTGDVVRYLPDGTLEILGRRDNQVKVRGNRIELEEIEAVLRRCPGVREAVVALWPPGDAEGDLAAYVVPDAPETLSAHAVRAHARAHLPRYMEPRYIELLRALPLTSIGKMDRVALPPPGSGNQSDRAYVLPRIPLEWQIARVWEEILGVRPVGATDDFFELGGHSLLAVRMMQGLERECGRSLPLTALFTVPTVEGLARALLRQEVTRFRTFLTPVIKEGDRPPFFFLHGDYNGGGFYSLALARGLDPGQPFIAVHPHPLVDRSMPPSVPVMAAELVAEIRGMQPHGPYRLGGHCNGGVVAFEVARQLVEAGEQVDALVVIDAAARNARFRALRGLARALAAVRGLEPAEEADLFVRLRDRSVAMVWRLAAWIPRLGQRGASVTGAPPQAGGEASEGEQERRPALVSWPESEPVREYRRIVRAHVPGFYSGRVTVLVPERALQRHSELGWSRVARQVEVRTVPGEHLTAITQHAPAVAERLRECLRLVASTPRQASDGA